MIDNNKGDRQKVKHGRACVSWGPKQYGPDMMLASCPVEAFQDLVEAVQLAAQEIGPSLDRLAND